MPWLEVNFKGSQQTASKYVRIAQKWGELKASYSRERNLSIRQALEILADKPEPKSDAPNIGETGNAFPK